MSFTANIKDEISKLEKARSENIAELSAFIRTNAKYSDEFIELNTENSTIAKRFYIFLTYYLILHLLKLIYFHRKYILHTF